MTKNFSWGGKYSFKVFILSASFFQEIHDCDITLEGLGACSGHGECLQLGDGRGSHVCDCEPEWAGEHCQYPFRACPDAVADFGNGTVRVWRSSLDITGGKNCRNGGQCYQKQLSNGGFGKHCACAEGWRGTACHIKWEKVFAKF